MSDKFVINGGIPLKGTVTVSGAKNAAVAILPATLLSRGLCIIDNLPMIDDVKFILDILKELGAEVTIDENQVVSIDTSNANTYKATSPLMTRMRASYYFVGVFLALYGKAEALLPGGCAIGRRPIDLHIKGFESLGANVEIRDASLIAEAEHLHGADIYLDQVSVGATINIMLAACMAEGTTFISNAAKEPHVVDVANFLNKMGANIRGAGTDTIRIRGVKKMHGASYSVIPDQIEAGTYMIAAAATKGDVVVQNIIPVHMEALTNKLIEMGVKIERGDDYIRVSNDRRPMAVRIRTLVYPGYPTDLQQPACVFLSTAIGTSIIVENIFESRFKYVDEIRRMGAKIVVNDRIAVIEGVEKLTGAPVRATDLRAGAALIIAGLMAEGTTNIYNIKYIDRGYYKIEEKLISLGADITRTEISEDEAYNLEYIY